MVIYEQYIKDVLSGKQVVGQNIYLAVKRFCELRDRDDIYFDAECVDEAIEFIAQMKHFLGKSAGQPFILTPTQSFILATLGLKWKSNNLRVCRNMYIQVARKFGKSAFIAALSLYMLLIDGEAAPQIACLANSREQAKIIFEYITQYAKSIDKKSEIIKYYRNYITTAFNQGTCKVFSADASKLDGLNISMAIIDEFHEARDRRLLDVMVSSMGMREQPLTVVITTAGFNLESPCHDMFSLGIEVLNGVKQDDSFFPFIFMMDPDDDWEDEKNWVKCQPNLDVTVTREFMRGELLKAKNDITAEVGVKTKVFNMWVSSRLSWLPMELVAKKMSEVDLNDYSGETCHIGVDLSSVSDLTALSVFIPHDGKYIFKTWTFLPEASLKDNPNEELYKKFIEEGSMIVTPGNVVDYTYVTKMLMDINQVLNIDTIHYDKWNSTSWAIDVTELGFNMKPFSQGVGHFNLCTKDFERAVKEDGDNIIIDKSSNILWQFGNVELKTDYLNNIKPAKANASSSRKIDGVIAMLTALGGYLENPNMQDIDIFVL